MQRAFAVVLGALMAVVGAEVPAVLAHFFSPGDCSPRPALELLMQQGLCYALPTGVDGFALCGAADSGGGSVTSYPAGSGCGGAAVATVPFLDGECLAGGAVVGAVFNCSGGSAPLSPALPLAAGTAAVLVHSNAACSAAQSDYLAVSAVGACTALPAPATYSSVAPPLLAAQPPLAAAGGTLPVQPVSMQVACDGDGGGGALFVSGAACGGGGAAEPVAFVAGTCLRNPYAGGPAAVQVWCAPPPPPPALTATLALAEAPCSGGLGGSPASSVELLAAAPAGACAPLPGGLSWRVSCDGADAGALLQFCAGGNCSGECTGVPVAAADGSCQAAGALLPPGFGGAAALALTCAPAVGDGMPAPPPGSAALSLWPAAGCTAPATGSAATQAIVAANTCLRLPGAAFVVGCQPGGSGNISTCDAACAACVEVATFDAPAGSTASLCIALPGGGASSAHAGPGSGANASSITVVCGSPLIAVASDAAPRHLAAGGATVLAALAAATVAGAW